MSSFIIFSALFVALLATAYLYIQHLFSYWKRRGIPFMKPKFPFGNFIKTFSQKLAISEELKEIYSSTNEPVIGIYVTVRPALLLRDPQIIRDILVKDFSSFHHRGWQSNPDVDPMADNIFLQYGDKWRDARAIFSPAFTSGKLKAIFETIVECTGPLQKYIDQFADKNETIEVREIFARFSINIIASVAFGLTTECLIAEPDSEFRKYGKQIFDPTLKNIFRGIMSSLTPGLAKFFRIRFTDKAVGDFMIDIVKQNLEYREKNDVTRKDFFQLLIQLRNTGEIQEDGDWTAKKIKTEKSLTLEQISAQAFLFFAAGYETTATMISFCLYELAKSPDIQQKVYEEICSVLEEHDGKLTYECVNEMKYTGYCIEETLRMHPPFGAIQRQCMKNYKLPNSNAVIEEGTLILIPVQGIQSDPQYYEDPDIFKPERFDEKLIAAKGFNEMPFLTFGDGPRNCLGYRFAKMQAKLVLISLLPKYKFELADVHKGKELFIDPKSPAKAPLGGINLKVLSR